MSMLLETVMTIVTQATAIFPAEIPNPAPVQPPGTDGVITIVSWTKWIGFAIAAVAIVVAGIRIVLTRRNGEGGEHVGILGYILGGCIIMGGGIGLVSMLMGG